MTDSQGTMLGMPGNGSEVLAGVLAALRQRERMLGSISWTVHGALLSAVIACIVVGTVWAAADVGVWRLTVIGLIVLAAGAPIGAIAGFLLPVSDLRLARAMDRAAASQDRFASALQLAGHHQAERVRLVIDDAAFRVRGTSAAAALPVRMPRTARWLAAPVAVLALMLLVLPQPRVIAAAVRPEISAADWDAINQELRNDLQQLNKPVSPEDEALQKQLEELAANLKEKPDKKEALKEIARLSDRIEQQRKALGSKGNSLRSAARAMSSSEALKQLASTLREGNYAQSAGEMKKLSDALKEGQLAPDAAELEAMASDLARLAEQMNEEDKEMLEACKNASNAAASMNKKQLADALKRFSEQMQKNGDKLRQRDNLEQKRRMLEELKRRMNQGQCSACDGEGCEQCRGNGNGKGKGNQIGRGAGKGGSKAGWGSAARWNGGTIRPNAEDRTPELSDAREQQGASTSFKVMSPDERARSGKEYAEAYAEFVQKAEADLDLESVPVAYREFLKKYFNSIKPKDEPVEEGEEP